MFRAINFSSFNALCAGLALMLFGSLFFLADPVVVLAQTASFGAADIASVNETRINSGNLNFSFAGLSKITILLKNGQTISLLSPLGLFDTKKELFTKRGYTGSKLQLVALADSVKSANTQISSITNTTNSVQPVYRIIGANLVNPIVNIYDNQGVLRVTNKCTQEVNKDWVCGEWTTFIKNNNLSQNINYLAVVFDLSGVRALQSFAIINNVIQRHDRLIATDPVSSVDSRISDPSRIDSVVISNQNPVTFTIRAKNESLLRIGVLNEDAEIIFDSPSALAGNNGVFKQTINNNFVDGKKYTLYVRGLFDGRFYKMYKTYEMVMTSGKLKLASDIAEKLPEPEVKPKPVATSTKPVVDPKPEVKPTPAKCTSGENTFPEGAKRNSITIDGKTTNIVDGYFVCMKGNWKREGSLPRPVTNEPVATSTKPVVDPKPEVKPKPVATSTKPVAKPEEVLARCTVKIDGKRAVIIGQEFKVVWQSTGVEKIEFLPSVPAGLEFPTHTLPLQGEYILKSTKVGEYTIKMRSTSPTGHQKECFRTITVLSADTNGITTTDQDIAVAGLRARISQQQQGIKISEMVIAELNEKKVLLRTALGSLETNLTKELAADTASSSKVKAVADLRARISQQQQAITQIETTIASRQKSILTHQANITTFEANIVKILNSTIGTPTVRGASTDINFQIYTTLGAVLNYLQTTR